MNDYRIKQCAGFHITMLICFAFPHLVKKNVNKIY